MASDQTTAGISDDARKAWRKWDEAKGILAEMDARRECASKAERQAYAELVLLGRKEGWHV